MKTAHFALTKLCTLKQVIFEMINWNLRLDRYQQSCLQLYLHINRYDLYRNSDWNYNFQTCDEFRSARSGDKSVDPCIIETNAKKKPKMHRPDWFIQRGKVAVRSCGFRTRWPRETAIGHISILLRASAAGCWVLWRWRRRHAERRVQITMAGLTRRR